MKSDITKSESGEIETPNGGSAAGDALATSDTPALFDLAEAMEIVEGDRQLLAQMAWSFCEHATQLLHQLPQAVARRDCSAILLTAHTMKGSVRNFAACSAEAASLALEHAAKAGDWQEIHSALEQFRTEITRLIPALAKLAEGEI